MNRLKGLNHALLNLTLGSAVLVGAQGVGRGAEMQMACFRRFENSQGVVCQNLNRSMVRLKARRGRAKTGCGINPLHLA